MSKATVGKSIDRETFDKVKQLLLRDTRTGPQQKNVYLFSGFLKCADCGKSMSRSLNHGTVYYYCRTYKDQSKTACTKHSIQHNRLELAVRYAIQQADKPGPPSSRASLRS